METKWVFPFSLLLLLYSELEIFNIFSSLAGYFRNFLQFESEFPVILSPFGITLSVPSCPVFDQKNVLNDPVILRSQLNVHILDCRLT